MSDPSAQPTVALNEIQRLRAYVSEVMAGLQSQQEILRTRGMNLPPGAIHNLENIDKDLVNLEKGLNNDETELGQLRSLADTSAMINSSLDLDEVLTHAMGEVIKLTGAERGYIVLKDDKTGELDFRAALTGDGRQNGVFEGSNTILQDVLNSSQPLLTDNAYKDPRISNTTSVAHMVLRSVLCVPLTYKDKVIGAVYVDNRLRAGVFTDREKDVLVAFGNQMAVAIENARLYMESQRYLAEITEIEELMSNVFDSVGNGIITTGPDGTIQLYNHAAADLIGYTPEKAVGQSLEKILPQITENHIQSVKEQDQRPIFDASVDVEGRGRRVMNLKLSSLKDGDQKIQGVTIVVDDVTEKRELNILKRYLPSAMVEKLQDLAAIEPGKGTRQEMTCMFVDVRSLASFPPGLRPKDVMMFLNQYLSVAASCVDELNGVIDKYMGTEIMVLFNTRLNEQKDHAMRAVESALLMRERFAQMYAEKPDINLNPPYFRVGIHSGWATTGNVGSRDRLDFTALGDTINLSHRLLENAAPGKIMISQSSIDYIQAALGSLPAHVQFEARDAIRVKGRQQATSVYEVSAS